MMSKKFEVHEFGTLSINGELKRMDESRYCTQDTVFRFGNTIAGAEITWIYIPELGIYVSSVPIVEDVTWDMLKADGYVDGKIVSIDNRKYKCRLPRSEGVPGTVNEWDRILEITDGFHDCFEKYCRPFWCQGSAAYGYKYRVIRGSYKRGRLKAYGTEKNDATFCDIGFRAVLEPIVETDHPEISIPEALKTLEIMATNLTGEAASMNGVQAEYAFRNVRAIDAAIEALKKYQNTGWTRMSEEMPEEGKRVLFWLGKIKIFGDDQSALYAMDAIRKKEIQSWLTTATHWMELPNPPKESK